MYFASFLPSVAAALGYANLLVQAPLGVLSSAVLVPILPAFASLVRVEKWKELGSQIRKGVLLSVGITLPVMATMVSTVSRMVLWVDGFVRIMLSPSLLQVPLAVPIVRLVYERFAFDTAATALVGSLLACYALGASFYLVRDVLVRAFYALGDGRTPSTISILAIVTNGLLDYTLCRVVGLNGEGRWIVSVVLQLGPTV
eukprot:scaffold1809_cov386-Prasinococcus_capsulatus_cf.AAC.47